MKDDSPGCILAGRQVTTLKFAASSRVGSFGRQTRPTRPFKFYITNTETNKHVLLPTTTTIKSYSILDSLIMTESIHGGLYMRRPEAPTTLMIQPVIETGELRSPWAMPCSSTFLTQLGHIGRRNALSGMDLQKSISDIPSWKPITHNRVIADHVSHHRIRFVGRLLFDLFRTFIGSEALWY